MNVVQQKPLLKIEGLRKKYHQKQVLGEINLNLFPEETIIIMGPSGCGKSTFIRCINRLTEPDEGRIFFEGEDITRLPVSKLAAVRRKIGFVFQQFNLIRRLNVLENVIFPLRLDGYPPEAAEEKGIQALSRVGLRAHVLNRPEELSGGEQQRVGIARALVLEPRLMLWDEPTAALDPILVGEVLEIMEELVKRKDTAMLVVTHEVGFAYRAADRIALMNQGEIVEEGTPETIFATPRSEIGEKYKKLLKT